MTTVPAHAECGRADAVIPYGVHGPATKWLCRRCRLTFGDPVDQAIADARTAENKACVEIMEQVIAGNGCDCDFDAPHEGIACEEHGHDPCLACRMERALNTIIARRTT